MENGLTVTPVVSGSSGPLGESYGVDESGTGVD